MTIAPTHRCPLCQGRQRTYAAWVSLTVSELVWIVIGMVMFGTIIGWTLCLELVAKH